jgi:hypothetical protein
MRRHTWGSWNDALSSGYFSFRVTFHEENPFYKLADNEIDKNSKSASISHGDAIDD